MTELCQEKGIDVEVLGVQRDNLTLPEYKAAMQKVEALEQQAEEMEIHNRELATQAGSWRIRLMNWRQGIKAIRNYLRSMI